LIGYLTSVFARLNPAAKVVGIDVIEELVLLSKKNIEKEDIDLFKYDRLTLHHQDGWKGWPAEQPYDAIHVGAAAIDLPVELLDQLKIGGRMVYVFIIIIIILLFCFIYIYIS
jgi:protein-L-isoaspartate(D-aspartate) O-methyltransferase